jgi:hypothetical protein
MDAGNSALRPLRTPVGSPLPGKPRSSVAGLIGAHRVLASGPAATCTVLPLRREEPTEHRWFTG